MTLHSPSNIIGASSQAYPGWIQTQEEELNLLDRSDWEESFESRKIRTILAEHVWEHLSYEEGVEAARICYDFLEPDGYIRCAVPDAFFRNEEYQHIVQIGGPGPKEHPAASHKIVHNYETITRCSKKQGSRLNYWNTVTKAESFIIRTGILRMVSFIDLLSSIIETRMMNWDLSR